MTTTTSESQRSNQVSSICSECGAPITFTVGTIQVKCSHCEAGLAVEKGTRLVRLGCPHCGGNFYYIDGSMCGRCPFCETSLLALSQDRVLRYTIRPGADPPEGAEGPEVSLVLLPFWHLGGLVYSWTMGSKVEMVEERQSGISEKDDGGVAGRPTRRDSGPMKVFSGRVLDISIPDPATLTLGVTSLRLRGAIFPLEPFTQEHESIGRVMPATLDHQTAKEKLFSRAMTLSSAEGMTRVDCRRFDLAAESLSLYYYPFWVQRSGDGTVTVWDGVSGEPEPISSPAPSPERPSSAIFDQLRVVELKCQACGQELPGGNHSTILPCRSCGTFWQVTSEGLESFDASYATPRLPAGDLKWLPFWQIPVQLSYAGKRAERVSDLTNALGVLRSPSELPKAGSEQELSFFVPAYGAMRAPRVDHAARDMTRHQPLMEAGSAGQGEIYNCFFSPEDGRRMAYATWIQILPGTVVHRIRSLRIQTGAARLWYVPFDSNGRELVNLLTGIRYDWAAFRGVRH